MNKIEIITVRKAIIFSGLIKLLESMNVWHSLFWFN